MNSCEAIIINISAHPGTDAACCLSAGVDLSLLQPPPPPPFTAAPPLPKVISKPEHSR